MSAVQPDSTSRNYPPGRPDIRLEEKSVRCSCRYRVELAGFFVCRAVDAIAIATDRDCSTCPVPETLEEKDCILLRATVTLAPRVQIDWTCGATEDTVDPHASSGCVGCGTAVESTNGSSERR